MFKQISHCFNYVIIAPIASKLSNFQSKMTLPQHEIEYMKKINEINEEFNQKLHNFSFCGKTSWLAKPNTSLWFPFLSRFDKLETIVTALKKPSVTLTFTDQKFELPQILYYRVFLVWDSLELRFGYQDRKSRPALAIWASHLPSFTMSGQMIKAGSKLLVFGNSACEIYEFTISWDK